MLDRGGLRLRYGDGFGRGTAQHEHVAMYTRVGNHSLARIRCGLRRRRIGGGGGGGGGASLFIDVVEVEGSVFVGSGHPPRPSAPPCKRAEEQKGILQLSCSGWNGITFMDLCGLAMATQTVYYTACALAFPVGLIRGFL